MGWTNEMLRPQKWAQLYEKLVYRPIAGWSKRFGLNVQRVNHATSLQVLGTLNSSALKVYELSAEITHFYLGYFQ